LKETIPEKGGFGALAPMKLTFQSTSNGQKQPNNQPHPEMRRETTWRRVNPSDIYPIDKLTAQQTKECCTLLSQTLNIKCKPDAKRETDAMHTDRGTTSHDPNKVAEMKPWQCNWGTLWTSKRLLVIDGTQPKGNVAPQARWQFIVARPPWEHWKPANEAYKPSSVRGTVRGLVSSCDGRCLATDRWSPRGRTTSPLETSPKWSSTTLVIIKWLLARS